MKCKLNHDFLDLIDFNLSQMNSHKISSKYTTNVNKKDVNAYTKVPINTASPSAHSQNIYWSVFEVDNTSKFWSYFTVSLHLSLLKITVIHHQLWIYYILS